MKRFVLMLAVAIWIPAGFYSCDKVEKPEEIVPVESVKLDQTRLDLMEGESKYLTATVSPLSRHRQTSDLGKLRPRCFAWWGEDEHIKLGHSSDYPSAKATGKIKELFSGGQILIENGKLIAFSEDSVYGTHPRTIFGLTADDRKIVLAVFDGRQATWSVGVNYPDMQAFMEALGCRWAINIDGGSSTFIVRKDGASFKDAGRFLIRNKPSDGSERAIGPGLAVVATD